MNRYYKKGRVEQYVKIAENMLKISLEQNHFIHYGVMVNFKADFSMLLQNYKFFLPQN